MILTPEVLASWLLAATWFVLHPSILSGVVLGWTICWIGLAIQHTSNHGGLCLFTLHCLASLLASIRPCCKILETKLNVALSEVLLGIHKLLIYPLAVTVDFSVILQSVQQHFSQVDFKFCILVELCS